MDQKAFSNIAVVGIVVVLIGVAGYFVLVGDILTKPDQKLEISGDNQTLESDDSKNQEKLHIHSDYKKIFSQSFEYGSGLDQFGILRVAGGAGPSSFATDNQNQLYIADTLNNRVKVLDSGGKQVSMINTGALRDIVLDTNNNLYGYGVGSGVPGIFVVKYDVGGALTGTIDNPSAFVDIFSGSGVYGNLRIAGRESDALYITDVAQNSYLIALTVGDFEALSQKIDGIFAQSGKRYRVSVDNASGRGMVNVYDREGVYERSVTVADNGISSLKFLQEDQYGDIYVLVETKGPPYVTQVQKYDGLGNWISTIDISESDYSVPVMKRVCVDWVTGDVWQVVPERQNLIVVRWSMLY